MPIYSVQAPNGKIYEIEGPAGATDAQLAQHILSTDPTAANPPSGERTWKEAAKDVGASVISGAGALGKVPAQIYGIATGDFDIAAMRAPDALQKYGESLKSQGLKVREALRDKAISEAEKQGLLAEFKTAIFETLKDPALATSFIAEQLPQLAPVLAGAKLLSLGAKTALQAGVRGTAGAVGTGAVMQGADIGADTYDAVYKRIKELYPDIPDEEAKAVALKKARVAAAEAGALSVAAQRIPGAKTIEKRLAGVPGEGRIKGLVGEAASEAFEEGAGKGVSNVGVQEVDPTQSLAKGIGTAAGLGAIGGGAFGAALGAHPAAKAVEESAPIDLVAEPAPATPTAEETVPEPTVRGDVAEPSNELTAAAMRKAGIPTAAAVLKKYPKVDLTDPTQVEALLADLDSLREKTKSGKTVDAVKVVIDHINNRVEALNGTGPNEGTTPTTDSGTGEPSMAVPSDGAKDTATGGTEAPDVSGVDVPIDAARGNVPSAGDTAPALKEPTTSYGGDGAVDETDDDMSPEKYEEAAKVEDAPTQKLTPQQATKLAKDADIVSIRGEPTVGDKVKAVAEAISVPRLRVKLTDTLASVDKKLFAGYGGKLRDAVGNINPMVLLGQALDASRIAEAAHLEGGLEFTKDGLAKATELRAPTNDPRFKLIAGEKVSNKGIIQYLQAIAEKQNKDYAQIDKELSTLLAGNREYELLQNNKRLDKAVANMKAEGKTSEAQQLHDKFYVKLMLPEAKINVLKAAYDASPEAQRMLEMMDAVRYHMIDNMVQVGRISQDKADKWKEASGYVPYDRLDRFEEALPKSTGKGGGLQGVAAYRRLEGGERKLGSAVEAHMQLMGRMVSDTVKVNAVQKALASMEKLGYAERVSPQATLSPDSESGLVKTYIDGDLVKYKLSDPLDVAAFGSLDRGTTAMIEAMRVFTQTVRAGVTLLPGFAFKQVAEDITRAYVFSGVENPKALIPRILMGLPRIAFGELTGKKTALIKSLENMGIIGSYDTTHSNAVKNVMLEAGASKRGAFRTLLHIGESLSKASDVTIRAAIYEQTMKETGDAVLAEQRAREIINFSRRGGSKSIGFLIHTVPFFNAYLRGMDKLYTAASGQGAATGLPVKQARALFMKRMATLSAMGLAYALMNVGDDDYDSLPDYVRDQNWVITGLKGLDFVPAIPLPRDLGFVFKAIPERIVQFMYTNGTDEERDGFKILKDMVATGAIDILASPNVTPVALKPLLENMTNHSFFLGRPLITAGQQKLDANKQYGSQTSDAMKALSDYLYDNGIEYSPIKLENLWRGVLGTAGGLSLSMADAMINPTRTDRPIHKDLLAQLTGASTFMKDNIGRKQLDDLYELYQKTSSAETTLNDLKNREPENAGPYMEKNAVLLSMAPIIKDRIDLVNDLRKKATMIDSAKDVPSNERRDTVREILKEQNDISKDIYRINKMIREAQAESKAP